MVVIGASEKHKVYIVKSDKPTPLSYANFIEYTSFFTEWKISHKLNNLSVFEGKIAGDMTLSSPSGSGTRQDDIKRGNYIYVLAGNSSGALIGKFEIIKPIYSNNRTVEIHAIQSCGTRPLVNGVRLPNLNSANIESVDYNNITLENIFFGATSPFGVCQFNNSTPYIGLGVITDGTENCSVKIDATTRVDAIRKICEVAKREWVIRHGSNIGTVPFSTGDMIYIKPRYGIDSIDPNYLRNFYLSGSLRNAADASGTEETDSIANDIIVNGKDVNGRTITTEVYDATLNRTELSRDLDSFTLENIGPADTSIKLTPNGSQAFSRISGTFFVLIDNEVIKCTYDSGTNSLEVLERGSITTSTTFTTLTVAESHTAGSGVCLIEEATYLSKSLVYVYVNTLVNYRELPSNLHWLIGSERMKHVGAGSDGYGNYLIVERFSTSKFIGATYAHTAGSWVFDSSYTPTYPDTSSGNPISENGAYTVRITDTSATSKDGLDKKGYYYLNARKTPPKRISIEVSNAVEQWPYLEIGDNIYISNSSSINIAPGAYRIIEYSYAWPQAKLILYLNNPDTTGYPVGSYDFADSLDKSMDNKVEDAVRASEDQKYSEAIDKSQPEEFNVGSKTHAGVTLPREVWTAVAKDPSVYMKNKYDNYAANVGFVRALSGAAGAAYWLESGDKLYPYAARAIVPYSQSDALIGIEGREWAGAWFYGAGTAITGVVNIRTNGTNDSLRVGYKDPALGYPSEGWNVRISNDYLGVYNGPIVLHTDNPTKYIGFNGPQIDYDDLYGFRLNGTLLQFKDSGSSGWRNVFQGGYFIDNGTNLYPENVRGIIPNTNSDGGQIGTPDRQWAGGWFYGAGSSTSAILNVKTNGTYDSFRAGYSAGGPEQKWNFRVSNEYIGVYNGPIGFYYLNPTRTIWFDTPAQTTGIRQNTSTLALEYKDITTLGAWLGFGGLWSAASGQLVPTIDGLNVSPVTSANVSLGSSTNYWLRVFLSNDIDFSGGGSLFLNRSAAATDHTFYIDNVNTSYKSHLSVDGNISPARLGENLGSNSYPWNGLYLYQGQTGITFWSGSMYNQIYCSAISQTGNDMRFQINDNSASQPSVYTTSAYILIHGPGTTRAITYPGVTGTRGYVDFPFIIRLPGFASAPTGNLYSGMIYYNSTSNTSKMYNGSSWIDLGVTPPAGSDRQIQFNNSGSFGADDDFVYGTYGGNPSLAIGQVSSHKGYIQFGHAPGASHGYNQIWNRSTNDTANDLMVQGDTGIVFSAYIRTSGACGILFNDDYTNLDANNIITTVRPGIISGSVYSTVNLGADYAYWQKLYIKEIDLGGVTRTTWPDAGTTYWTSGSGSGGFVKIYPAAHVSILGASSNPTVPSGQETYYGGVLYFNSSTKKFMGYNSTTWIDLGLGYWTYTSATTPYITPDNFSRVYVTNASPAVPVAGMMWFDTVNNKFYGRNNSAIIDIAGTGWDPGVNLILDLGSSVATVGGSFGAVDVHSIQSLSDYSVRLYADDASSTKLRGIRSYSATANTPFRIETVNSGNIEFYVAGAHRGRFTTTGLYLEPPSADPYAATVYEFSSNVSLGTSNAVVSTQLAVKTYIDARLLLLPAGSVGNVQYKSGTAFAGNDNFKYSIQTVGAETHHVLALGQASVNHQGYLQVGYWNQGTGEYMNQIWDDRTTSGGGSYHTLRIQGDTGISFSVGRGVDIGGEITAAGIVFGIDGESTWLGTVRPAIPVSGNQSGINLGESYAQWNIVYCLGTAYGDNTTNRYIAITSPMGITASYIMRWPVSQGASNTYLKNDGSGNLSWAAVSGGGVPGGANTQIQFNDSSAFGATADLVFNKSTYVLAVGQVSGHSGYLQLGSNSSNQIYSLYTMTSDLVVQGASGVQIKLAATGAVMIGSNVSMLRPYSASDVVTLGDDTYKWGNIYSKGGLYMYGATSGYVKLVSPAIAGTQTLTLPGSQVANGYLKTDGSGNLSWSTVTGGGVPGGSNTYIQFNNSGAFGGEATFTYSTSGSNKILTLGGASNRGYLQLGHHSGSNQIYEDDAITAGTFDMYLHGHQGVVIKTALTSNTACIIHNNITTLRPMTNNSVNLGHASFYWNNAYLNNSYINYAEIGQLKVNDAGTGNKRRIFTQNSDPTTSGGGSQTVSTGDIWIKTS
jgi:hypothetical protein